MTSSIVSRVLLVTAALSGSGCHVLLGQPIACEPTDEATCPGNMHCVEGACVDGAPRCGDGAVTGAEACDDGNDVDDDGCSRACTTNPAACGNGIAEGGEACDDGNDVDDDGCSNLCTENLPQTCGNGVVDVDEACDDGNNVDDDACSNACLENPQSTCGDGVVDGNETCDDGNRINDDTCDNTCQPPGGSCGDGLIDNGEECDDGNILDGDGCSNACSEETPAACGDGRREGTEACDDGNDIDNDVCANDCTLSPLCGNGQIDAGEACDPFTGDDCNLDCTPSVCGDGQVGTDEQCDDDGQETITCTAECDAAAFNNGRIDSGLGEQCDDGNSNPNDACHDGVIANVSSCSAIARVAPTAASGSYFVDVDGEGPLSSVAVHCDMDVDGGGWTRVLLTRTDRSIAELPLGDTRGAGRLSTAHVVALARRSHQVHIRTLDDEARSATSVPGAAPIHRLRLGASLAPVQRTYPQPQVIVDWSGPFASRLAASSAPTHTTWPDVYEAGGNTAGLQLFDNGTQLVSRWEGTANEAIEVWLRTVDVCGDGLVQGDEQCDDGNAIDADGCSQCRSDTCNAGIASAATMPVIGTRAMVHSVDVDEDGFKDLVTVELVSNAPTVSIARGSAHGLQRAVPVVLADMPDVLTDIVGGVGGSEVIDIDNDGALDLVLFDQFNCTFLVFAGTGTGAFEATPTRSPVLDIGTGVCGDGGNESNSRRSHLGAFLDVDSNGRLDAVLPASDGALRVVFQQPDGSFAINAAQSTISPGNARCTPQQVIAADLLGLGQAQSLVISCQMVLETEQQIVIVLQHTATGFQRHEVQVDAHLTDLIAVDLNSDGMDDIVGTGTRPGGTKLGGQPVTRLLRNNGGFVFTTAATLNGNGGRVAINDEHTALGLGVVGGTAFLRVAIGAGATTLSPSSSAGPVVTGYAMPAFVDADGVDGSEYVAVADGTLFVQRADSCVVNR